MEGLIIKRPWIDYILEGKKVWEIRCCNTHKRRKIELIESGTGLIVGCCELVDCIKLSFNDFKQNLNKHCVQGDNLPYKNTFAWVMANAHRYTVPKKYKHPKGAIIWVKLKDEVK